MLTRRGFLGWMAGVIPAGVVVRSAHLAAMDHLTTAPSQLNSLAAAVLPSELRDADVGRIATAFRKWIDGYRENAELVHGYGNSRLRFTGPTPATRWTRQLDDLDRLARSSSGNTFDALTVVQRQAIVRPLLSAERGSGIPGSPESAQHVAAALLSFFYSSPAATDLCYEAAIGKNQCRPLADSTKRPSPRGHSSARLTTIRSSAEAGS